MTFGEKLKKIRKEKNMSIKNLAELSQLSAVQISNYEHGHYSPNSININKLAKALGCEYEDLAA